MTQQQHNRSIRKLAESRGTDPSTAYCVADIARALNERIGESDYVIWASDSGILAWEALVPAVIRFSESIENIYLVSSYKYIGAVWTRLEKNLRDKNVNLRKIRLAADSGQIILPEHTASVAWPSTGSSDGFLVSALKSLLARIDKLGDTGITISPGRTEAAEAESVDSGAVLIEWLDTKADTELILFSGISEIKENTLKPFTPLKPMLFLESIQSRSDCFALDGRTALIERFLIAECAYSAGMKPLVAIRPGEITPSLPLLESMMLQGYKVVLYLEGPWNSLTPFLAIADFPILTPASLSDGAGALDWLLEADSAGVIFEPGDNIHVERAALKTGWENGKGIILRESTKGSAGSVLLIVPGNFASLAGRAADRLVRDNISVTVLSLRFLNPVNLSKLQELVNGFDVAVVAEETSFPGSLRNQLSEMLLGNRDKDVLFTSGIPDAITLADKASGKLRDNRLRRTVDDVKADRWR